jgi:hypothetical protein
VETEENDGKLEMLPCMEYFLHSKELPIRTSKDKLTSSKDKLQFAPVDRACPAQIDSDLKTKLFQMAAKAHKALECQHYSLYDVRVDPEGNPYFIEASPYCSFSPKSAIVVMSCGDHSENFYKHQDLFYRFAMKAVRNYRQAMGGGKEPTKQKLGMRYSSSLPTR